MDIGQIQDVTDSLALMPDAALQKYAMMNKDDPYIMSLAMSENNRRQKLRTAQQGQAGQMPAPKVVDQAIQSINPPPAPPPQAMPPQQPMPQAQGQLPEDQGIAQLPAPNMQGMADGGIVGYAAGGVPEGAIIMGNMYVDPKTGERKYLPGVEPGRSSMAGMTMGEAASSATDYAKRKLEDLLVTNERAKQKLVEKRQAEDTAAAATAPDYKTPQVNYPVDKPAALPPTDAGAGRGSPMSTRELIPVSTRADARDAAKADSGLQSLLRTGAGTSTSTSQAGAPETDPTKIAAEYAKVRDAYTPQNRFGKEIGELTAAEAAMHAQNKAQLLADIEKRGPAMAGYETRLKGREERLSKQEADLSGMSIMEAGLAMMAGTSPHALTNIGAGAQSGVKSYKAGLEKLAEARDKLDDSFSRIEELRRSEGTANDKEIRQAGKDIAQTAVEAKKLTLSALMKDGELGRKEAETAFTTMAANRKAVFEQDQQNKRTAIEQAGASGRTAFSAQVQREIAAMPGATERMYSTLGGGDVKKGFEFFTAATAEGKGNEAIIQAIIKTPELLGAVSPELRKVIEAEIMGRFPQVQNKAGSRP